MYINFVMKMLRKGVYPYGYINSWEKFNETLLTDKKAFHSELHLEKITDEDYTHAPKVFKKFDLKNLVDFNDLYV